MQSLDPPSRRSRNMVSPISKIQYNIYEPKSQFNTAWRQLHGRGTKVESGARIVDPRSGFWHTSSSSSNSSWGDHFLIAVKKPNENKSIWGGASCSFGIGR